MRIKETYIYMSILKRITLATGAVLILPPILLGIASSDLDTTTKTWRLMWWVATDLPIVSIVVVGVGLYSVIQPWIRRDDNV